MSGERNHYATCEGWGDVPAGWVLGDVAAVGVDRADNVYVFNRGDHPMMIFSREGRFLSSWGEGLFRNPHGLHIGPDDMVYCTDDSDHTVRKCSPDGKVLLEIGVPNRPSPYMSGLPFHRCTHTALSPSGEIYVSDGYGNACVHKYSPDGRWLLSWGEPGTRPGQFNIPHNICCDDDGYVYVADRENHRIQIFDGGGTYVEQWNNLHRPCALCMCNRGEKRFYVGELAPQLSINRDVPNLGPRVSILDATGNLEMQLGGDRAGLEPEQFLSPHGIAVDSFGDIYVGEVSTTVWPRLFPGVPLPNPLRRLRKLVKKK